MHGDPPIITVSLAWLGLAFNGPGPATPTASVSGSSGLTHGGHAGALGSSSTLEVGRFRSSADGVGALGVIWG